MSKTAKKQDDDKGLTPMMQQYWGLKEQYPDCMLFYRMGDFYELFFDDAVRASEILNITLTKRGRQNGEDIPMCGVPVHSHETYLSRLIKHDIKIALCEQTETPKEAKKRGGYKALVNRDVIRVITQGTLTEDHLLPKNQHNFLSAIALNNDGLSMAWLDLSTGDFIVQSIHNNDLGSLIERISPKEILISEKIDNIEKYRLILNEYKNKLTIQPNSRFDNQNAQKRLEDLFDVQTLDSFGDFTSTEVTVAGALIDYVHLTQKGSMARLSPPRQISMNSIMEIDGATRRNLELTRTMSGETKGSLLHNIDMTVTGAGGRCLNSDLSSPLTNVDDINTRLDMVDFFVSKTMVREKIRDFLRRCPDIERALSRLSLGRGGPRDLACIRDTLCRSVDLQLCLLEPKNKDMTDYPQGIRSILQSLKQWQLSHPLIDTLSKALAEELPNLARDGGFIASGYDPVLDKFRVLKDESRQLVAVLQKKYSDLTGISALKIKHNNMLGYFIDVNASNGDKLMQRANDENDACNIFIHRQTLANNVRFSTVELSDLEKDIADAGDKSLALEQSIFQKLIIQTLNLGADISKTARALARLDVSAALAELATDRKFTRPELTNDLSFDVKLGRHPVVEKSIQQQNNENFIANNCHLNDGQKLWLLTGPNMAGKSTFLRQNALIALLAQSGCYVPAEYARIGIIDRLFSRVGAADDLARGRSTFMVEMVETAIILNQATDRSFVILDEIGRGTATFDGLSIAWASIEHLHENNKCRTLFATHYHELTQLKERLNNLSCHTMKVKEWKNNVIFMHEVIDGSADRSYGIHVARLAGLPKKVIKRAENILKLLESKNTTNNLSNDDLPLFSALSEPEENDDTVINHEVFEMLEDVNPDNLTAREALDLVYKLKLVTAQN